MSETFTDHSILPVDGKVMYMDRHGELWVRPYEDRKPYQRVRVVPCDDNHEPMFLRERDALWVALRCLVAKIDAGHGGSLGQDDLKQARQLLTPAREEGKHDSLL